MAARCRSDLTHCMTNPASPFDHPEIYDGLFDGLDFDIAHWVDFARKGGGPALDVACGTGRVLIRLLEAGVDADGVDISAPMLRHARGKVAQLGYGATLLEAPMQTFKMPRRYRRIVCAFNSFAHNMTAEDQLATLRNIREHLEPGGAFSMFLSFPRPELWTSGNDRVLEHEANWGDGRLRIYDTRNFNPVDQAQNSRVEYELMDAMGKVSALHVTYTDVRWVYKNELELLLAAAGFERFTIHGDFQGGQLLGKSDTMVVVAWK